MLVVRQQTVLLVAILCFCALMIFIGNATFGSNNNSSSSISIQATQFQSAFEIAFAEASEETRRKIRLFVNSYNDSTTATKNSNTINKGRNLPPSPSPAPVVETEGVAISENNNSHPQQQEQEEGGAASTTAEDRAASSPPTPSSPPDDDSTTTATLPRKKKARKRKPEEEPEPTIEGCPRKMNFPFELPARCPHDELVLSKWNAALLSSGRQQRTWTLVDVGANKGYSIAGMLEGIGVEGINRRTWALDVVAWGVKRAGGLLPCERIGVMCGGCCECGEEPLSLSLSSSPSSSSPEELKKTSSPPPVCEDDSYDNTTTTTTATPSFRVFAFEPALSNFQFLQHQSRKVMSMLSTTTGSTADIKVINAAVGKKYIPKVPFEAVPFGVEAGFHNPEEKTYIPQLPLSSVLHKNQVDYVDVLMTDTEGMDYFVADGARAHLDTGNVGLYIFELWGRDRPLKKHVQRLEAAGFECFWPMKLQRDKTEEELRDLPTSFQMVNASSHCWYSGYNFVSWMNLACVNARKEPELLEVFLNLTKEELVVGEKVCRPFYPEDYQDMPASSRSWLSDPAANISIGECANKRRRKSQKDREAKNKQISEKYTANIKKKR